MEIGVSGLIETFKKKLCVEYIIGGAADIDKSNDIRLTAAESGFNITRRSNDIDGQRSVADRLNELESIKFMISEDDYKQKRQDILASI